MIDKQFLFLSTRQTAQGPGKHKAFNNNKKKKQWRKPLKHREDTNDKSWS